MDINTYTTNLSSFVRAVRDYYSLCGYFNNDVRDQFTLPLAMVSYTLQDLSRDDQAELLNTLQQHGFINRVDDSQITFSEKFVSQASQNHTSLLLSGAPTR